jgi:hypothetical protein
MKIIEQFNMFNNLKLILIFLHFFNRQAEVEVEQPVALSVVPVVVFGASAGMGSVDFVGQADSDTRAYSEWRRSAARQ